MSEVPAFSNTNKYSPVGNLKIDHLFVFKSSAFSPLIIIPFLSKHLVNEICLLLFVVLKKIIFINVYNEDSF